MYLPSCETLAPTFYLPSRQPRGSYLTTVNTMHAFSCLVAIASIVGLVYTSKQGSHAVPAKSSLTNCMQTRSLLHPPVHLMRTWSVASLRSILLGGPLLILNVLRLGLRTEDVARHSRGTIPVQHLSQSVASPMLISSLAVNAAFGSKYSTPLRSILDHEKSWASANIQFSSEATARLT